MRKLSKRILAVETDPLLWELFDRYLASINNKLKKRDWPQVTQARLVGAILAHFLLAHERHILDGFTEIELEKLRSKLGKRFSPAELEALGFTGATEIPNVLRVSGTRQAT